MESSPTGLPINKKAPQMQGYNTKFMLGKAHSLLLTFRSAQSLDRKYY